MIDFKRSKTVYIKFEFVNLSNFILTHLVIFGRQLNWLNVINRRSYRNIYTGNLKF